MKILLSVLVLFLFLGCSDQSKKDTKQVASVEKKIEVKQEAPQVKKVELKKVVKKEEPKKVEVQKVIAKTKEKVKEIAKTISSVTDNKEVKKVTQKISKALDSITAPTTKAESKESATKDTTAKQVDDLQNVAAGLMAGFGAGVAKPKKSSVDAVALFKSKCSSCHGAKAGKKALGKSEIISKWDSQKIADALNGYKNGTFGGSMKAIMQGQAKGLSAEQISALSKAIPKL